MTRCVYLVPEAGTAQGFGKIPFACTLPDQKRGANQSSYRWVSTGTSTLVRKLMKLNQ